jgi:hypothetical protein
MKPAGRVLGCKGMGRRWNRLSKRARSMHSGRDQRPQCPQLARADTRPETADSRCDPQRSKAALKSRIAASP